MAELALFSFALGSILGCRYKVFSLVPAIGVTEIAIVVDSFAREISAWTLAIEIVVAWALLQVGYLVGSTFSSYLSFEAVNLLHRHPSKRGRRQSLSLK